jgi:hypothetical protein
MRREYRLANAVLPPKRIAATEKSGRWAKAQRRGFLRRSRALRGAQTRAKQSPTILMAGANEFDPYKD